MFATPAFPSLHRTEDRDKATVTKWPWRVLTILFLSASAVTFMICCFIHYSSKLEKLHFQLETKWKECDDDDDDYDRSVGLFGNFNVDTLVIHLFERRSQGKSEGKAVRVHAM